MAIYCISDIHGHKAEFDSMLDKIAFSDSDELYVLGDIIDRGPGSVEMLKWAIDESGDNVHFLRGNHEDMARHVIERDPERLACLHRDDAWTFNRGYETAEKLLEQTDADWRKERLIPWLNDITPFQMGVHAGGREFVLVHAGFDPWAFETHPQGWQQSESFIDYDMDYMALRETYELPDGLGKQFAQYLMWVRSPWLLDLEPSPVETVFGHSCVKSELVALLEEKGVPNASGGDGRIFHAYNKHGIDCGCAYANETFTDGKPMLGCLRLDDMEEFYVPVEPHAPQQFFF